MEPHGTIAQSRPQSMTKPRMGTSWKKARTLPPVERNKTPQVDDLMTSPLKNEILKGKALNQLHQKQLPPIGVPEHVWEAKYTSTARAASAHHKDKSNFTLDGRPSTTHSNYANVHKRFETGTPNRNVNAQGLNVQGSNFGGYHQDDPSDWGKLLKKKHAKIIIAKINSYCLFQEQINISQRFQLIRDQIGYQYLVIPHCLTQVTGSDLCYQEVFPLHPRSFSYLKRKLNKNSNFDEFFSEGNCLLFFFLIQV